MSPRFDPRELDRQLVPAAARGLRRGLDAVRGQRERAAGGLRRRATTAGAAAARLDDRATSDGPLRLLREVPQLAVLVVAAVLVAGSAAAVVLTEPDPAPTSAASPEAADTVVRLGVPAGADVDSWLAQSREALDDAADRQPDARLVAVVHLERYVPAVELLALLDGVAPLRFYLRAPEAGPDAEVVALPVSQETAAALLPALCAATAARKAEDARGFAELAASLDPVTPEEQAGLADFEAESARAAAEAEAYAGACTTGFAAAVEGAAEDLRALLGRDGVRGLEAAPAGALLAELDVEPLLPESAGVLPSGRER